MKKFFYIIKHNTNAESSLTAGIRQRYYEALEMIKVTFFQLICNFLRKFASNKKLQKLNIMNLPWYSYLPVVAGIIGGLIGGHYYKKYNRKKKA